MPARLLKSCTAQYPDPIVLRKGDPVSLGKRDTDFPGWIWATSSIDGKSGWVPEQFLATENGETRSLSDYSARELSAEEGEIVSVVEELLGWALVETQDGALGWLPVSHLAHSVSPSDFPL